MRKRIYKEVQSVSLGSYTAKPIEDKEDAKKELDVHFEGLVIEKWQSFDGADKLSIIFDWFDNDTPQHEH